MDEPTKRRGRWWQQKPDGTWLRWDDELERWEPQDFPPPPTEEADASSQEPAIAADGSGAAAGAHERAGSTSTKAKVDPKQRFGALVDRAFDAGTQIYIATELDRLRDQLGENETPLTVFMARDARTRNSGAAVITTERFMFIPRGRTSQIVTFDLAALETADLDDADGSILLAAPGKEIVLDELLPADPDGSTYAYLTDPHRRKTAAEQETPVTAARAPEPPAAPARPEPKPGMKRCPRCAEEVRRDAVVCRSCGHNFGSAAQASGHRAPTPAGVNIYAVASLVLSLVWLGGVGSILAIVFANIARKEITETGQSGEGMATAGLIIGWIGVILMVMTLGAMCSVGSKIEPF